MKYLTGIEIRTLLYLGKTVEMFLGKNNEDDTLTWIDVRRVPGDRFLLNINCVYDEGDVDNVDLYDFSPVDPDEPFTTLEFETLEALLTHIKTKYQLDRLLFVNRWIIQDEYSALKKGEQRVRGGC